MPEFFTVDRSGSLRSGQVLDIDLHLTGLPLYAVSGYYSGADLEAFARDLFGGGISRWGKAYLFNQHITGPNVPVSLAIELVVELVRRESFPERPSRLSSVFGSSTLDDARQFKTLYGTPSDPIFRVSCDTSFRCDFDLLRMGHSILAAWLLATKYWSGKQGPDPTWEELLVPPVNIMERVD